MCFRDGRSDAEAAITPRDATAISDASAVKTPDSRQAMLAFTYGSIDSYHSEGRFVEVRKQDERVCSPSIH